MKNKNLDSHCHPGKIKSLEHRLSLARETPQEPDIYCPYNVSMILLPSEIPLAEMALNLATYFLQEHMFKLALIQCLLAEYLYYMQCSVMMHKWFGILNFLLGVKVLMIGPKCILCGLTGQYP